jgi:hypothetical protein
MLALAMGVIAYPLLRASASDDRGGIVESELSDLLYRRDSLYTALKDLDFDHATGKINDADHAEMKERFEREAVEILEKIDAAEEGVAA